MPSALAARPWAPPAATATTPVSPGTGAGVLRPVVVPSPSWPFQIPLGALLPVRVENLLPACKNLGVTHITNGCYRLHPVEWNIGEAAGALAAYCLAQRLTPRQVRNTPQLLADFQRVLTNVLGFTLIWPPDIRVTPAEEGPGGG